MDHQTRLIHFRQQTDLFEAATHDEHLVLASHQSCEAVVLVQDLLQIANVGSLMLGN